MTSNLALAAVLFTAAAAAQTDAPITREGAYWVQSTEVRAGSLEGISKLRVVTVGDILLRGAENTEVTYTLKKRVRAHTEAEALRLMELFATSVTRRGDRLEIAVGCAPSRRLFPQVSVTAPRALLETYLETSRGSIDARRMDGMLVAESGGGRITAGDIGGGLRAQTVGGEIRLGRVSGIVKCVSGAGNISAEWIDGDSWLETAGGEIAVEDAGAELHVSTGGGNISVTRARGSLYARSAGGLIEVGQAAGLVLAETGGGAILVGAAAGVKCQSTRGAIRLRSVSGPLRASTGAGNIVARFSGMTAPANSFLDTGSGDITVIIPSNLALTVRAFSSPGAARARILTDFPEIRVRHTGQAGYSPLMAEGSINGGGPLLRVTAVGGTIYFRRHGDK